MLNLVSDLFAQVIATWTSGKPLALDRRRALKFAGFGFAVSGPLLHFWYKLLNDVLPPATTTLLILLRIALDRLLFAPLFFALFHAWNGLIDNNLEAVPKEIERKVPATVVKAMWLWVPAQWVNFAYVPLPLKVLYGNVVALVWNIYFSSISNARRV